MNLTVEEAAKASKGKLCCDNVKIDNISTDTRTITKGSLFVALKGESFDGHKFVDAAFEKGAVCAVVQEPVDKPHILVKDTRIALGDIARYYLSKFNIPVVAITGSTGKTTTKDMIASVLEQKYNVLKTQGNFNNDIGVPLTIFNINEKHTAAVIEMGMNHFGEISYLSSVAKPDIAVITNVGVSHIENLGSREGILKAKCEIFENMTSDGIKIINNDNDMLAELKGDFCRYGTDSKNNVWADEIKPLGLEGIECCIHCDAGDIHAKIPVPGNHIVSNGMAAAAVGAALGLNAEEIKKGLESFQPTGMRMNIVKTPKYTIINDVYNANPASVKAGIDVLASVSGKKCCVLGDMLELGDYSPQLHKEVGTYAVEKGIDVIVCIGKDSKNTYEGAVGADNLYYFETKEEFINNFDDVLTECMTVLVKASRGMHFEEIVKFINER